MAESDLIRGNVDTVILKILYEGDRYGYEIIKQISERSGRQLEIKQPTIYACLKRLEKQGFISSYWDSSESGGGRRKYYSLTDRGREVFVTYKNEWERSRDLFGELIMSDEPIFGGDDFFDVEEDSYDIPKRRSRKKPASPRPPKDDVPVQDPFDPTVVGQPSEPVGDPSEPEPSPVRRDEVIDDGTIIYDHGGDFPPYRVDSTVTEQPPASEPIELPPQEPTEPDARLIDDGYIQESFLTPTEPQPPVREEVRGHALVGDDQTPTSVGDPQSIIDELYASTFTGADSYYHARGRTYDETYTDDSPAPDPQPSEQAQPVGQPAPPPSQDPAPAPTPVQTRQEPPVLEDLTDGESLARREYKDILNGLAEMCDQSVARSDRETAATEGTEEGAVITNFEEVRRAVSELGNEVTVREHNDSAKIYTHRYQYFSNRLMLTQYTITCALMFLMGLIMFLTFYFGLGMRMRYDNILYIFAGLFPIVMFIIVVIAFVGDPDKKRNININFRSSIITRVVMMLQLMVVFYCLNLIWGMPVTFSEYYVPSVVIPFVYALFVPISKIIFMGLLKSERYNAD